MKRKHRELLDKHYTKAREIYKTLFQLMIEILRHDTVTWEHELYAVIATLRPFGLFEDFQGIFKCNEDQQAITSIANILSKGGTVGHWVAYGHTGSFDSFRGSFQKKSKDTCGHHCLAFLIMDAIAPFLTTLINDTDGVTACR